MALIDSLKQYSTNLKLLFLDQVDVYKPGPHEEPDGSTSVGYPKDPSLTGIACKYSPGNMDSSKLNPVNNPREQNPFIICGLDEQVGKGDKLVITRNSLNEKPQQVVGYAGEPNVCLTHLEILVKSEGEA